VRAYLEDYAVFNPEVRSSTEPPNEGGLIMDDLTGTEWLLVDLNGREPLPDTRIRLRVEEERVTGYGGCNDYGAPRDAFPQELLRIEAGCGDRINVQELAYFTILEAADTFKLEGDTTLTISGPEGSLTYARLGGDEALRGDPAELVDTYWVLRGWQGPEGGRLWAGTNLFWVRFTEDGTLTGFAGCRKFEGAYTVERGVIFVTTLTMLGDPCDDALTATEGNFTTALSENAGWGIGGDGQMQWVTKPGDTLTFTPYEAAPRPATAADLSGEWVLVSLNGEPPLGDEPLTLTFGPENVEGFAGCNGFFGTGGYTIEGTRVDLVEGIGSTQIGCTDEINLQEEAYQTALSRARTLYIVGNTLVLAGPEGILTFEQ
jgi:heat shock protein HslJ